jgi:hypothetical protein
MINSGVQKKPAEQDTTDQEGGFHGTILRLVAECFDSPACAPVVRAKPT